MKLNISGSQPAAAGVGVLIVTGKFLVYGGGIDETTPLDKPLTLFTGST